MVVPSGADILSPTESVNLVKGRVLIKRCNEVRYIYPQTIFQNHAKSGGTQFSDELGVLGN